MSNTQPRTCPECQGPMHQIRLLDKAHLNFPTDLEYGVYEAKKPGFWDWPPPSPVGQVNAFMCDQCGRILLYGVPKAGA